MKIRNGFVSNSSSSSFAIMGIQKYYSRSSDFEKDFGVNIDFDGYQLYSDIHEFLSSKLGSSTLHFIVGGEGDLDIAIGHNFDDMKDDETKEEFIQRTEEEFKKVFGDKFKVSFHYGEINQ